MTVRATWSPPKPQIAVGGPISSPPATFRVQAGDDRRVIRTDALDALHGGRRVVILVVVGSTVALAARIDATPGEVVINTGNRRLVYPDEREAVAAAMEQLEQALDRLRLDAHDLSGLPRG